MEIGPIFRAMFKNAIGVGLLVLEIAVTLAITLNCISLIQQNLQRMQKPTGLDEAHIMGIDVRPFGEAYNDRAFVQQRIEQDLAYLRAQAGVVDVTPISVMPLVGGGSSTQRKPLGAGDERLVRTPQYIVDEHFLEAMGLELLEGRSFEKADMIDFNAPPPEDGVFLSVALVTKDLADSLFPDGDALGKRISSPDGQAVNTIVGIVKHMFTPYDGGASGMETRILFRPSVSGGASRIQYLARAEPGAFNELFTELEQGLAELDPERVITVRSLAEIKQGGLGSEAMIVQILTVIMVLLLAVTGLGIYGMASFAVAERRRQIGTRRALGARKRDIVRYFLTENAMITAFGAALGLVLAFALNVGLVNLINNLRPLAPTMALLGSLLLFALGALATLRPAVKAANIPPIVAAQAA